MDSTQFNQQILSLSDKLFRFAKSILQNGDAAQDAVQDLNLKLWEKRKMLDQVENVPAFAMRSMRNLCLDVLRKNKDEVELPAEVEYNEPNPHLQIERRDMVKQVKDLIDGLPELQRTIIRMRDVEGMEIGEIAFVTSLTENAVTVNLSRARQRIREKILFEQNRTEKNIWKS